MPRRLPTTDHVFAVVDDPSDAPGIVAALRPAGIDSNRVTTLRGLEGAARIDATGASTGLGARLRQAVSFTMADQMPDFVLYEAALAGGRTVLVVPVTSAEMKLAVWQILRDQGAHFVNFYGRFVTEELEAWRGPELDIPNVLRR